MSPIKALLRLRSPGGAGGRLSILIFHRVYPKPDPIFPDEPDAKWFSEVLARLKGWFNVLPLDEAVGMLREGRLPVRAAAITFDDGYADNHEVAMPILQRHGLPATFFIATGFLDGGCMWNDMVVESVRECQSGELDLRFVGVGQFKAGSPTEKRLTIESILAAIKYRPPEDRLALARRIAAIAKISLRKDLMMSSEQVRQMDRNGMLIGAHTVSHPILARLERKVAEREIAESRRHLEEILGKRVGLFAYPNGKPGADYLPEHAEIVRGLGFDAAVSTHPAAVRSVDELFDLPRFTPWDRSLMRFGARMVRNFSEQGIALSRNQAS